ncbi:MAG: hypothetical protein U9P14_07475, partial [Gemmatimonadota bacterium]|nr:hypothetical protein [Gemmatimonadota bacterium]
YDFRALEQRLVVEVESEICLEEGGMVIDPLPVFDIEHKGDVELFTDMVHKTCYGDKLLARCVYEGLVDKVREAVLQ